MKNSCRLPDCYPVSLTNNEIEHFQTYSQQDNWNVPNPVCPFGFIKTINWDIYDGGNRCHYHNLYDAKAACNCIDNCTAVVKDMVGFEPRSNVGQYQPGSGNSTTWNKIAPTYTQQNNWNVPNPVCIPNFRPTIQWDINNSGRCHYIDLQSAQNACNCLGSSCQAVVRDSVGFEPRTSVGQYQPGAGDSTTWHKGAAPSPPPPPPSTTTPPPPPPSTTTPPPPPPSTTTPPPPPPSTTTPPPPPSTTTPPPPPPSTTTPPPPPSTTTPPPPPSTTTTPPPPPSTTNTPSPPSTNTPSPPPSKYSRSRTTSDKDEDEDDDSSSTKNKKSSESKQLITGVDNMVLFGGMGFLIIIIILLK